MGVASPASKVDSSAVVMPPELELDGHSNGTPELTPSQVRITRLPVEPVVGDWALAGVLTPVVGQVLVLKFDTPVNTHWLSQLAVLAMVTTPVELNDRP
jgi:hypothetical protein